MQEQINQHVNIFKSWTEVNKSEAKGRQILGCCWIRSVVNRGIVITIVTLEAGVAWSRVYRIYYDKSRRLSLSSSGRKAHYLSYIQNSYASVHSFGTPSVTPYSVIPPSCPALSTAPVIVVIGPAGSIPIRRGDSCGTVRSVRGAVGVVFRFGVRSFGSEFWVGVLGRSFGSEFWVGVWGGYTVL
jgi:hypothetical protein